MLAALLFTPGLVGNPAHAATKPGGTVPTKIHFTVKMYRAAKPGTASPMDVEVTLNYCNVQVNNPHSSTHVPENVNVTGGMTCTPYPVDESDLSLQLYYNGESYAYDDEYLSDVFANPVQAATPCLNGDYYATIDYWVYFGPQWTPETWDGTVESPVVSITC